MTKEEIELEINCIKYLQKQYGKCKDTNADLEALEYQLNCIERKEKIQQILNYG